MNTLAEIEKKLNEVVKEFNDYKKNHRKKPLIGETVEIAGIDWLILDKTEKGYFAITADFIKTGQFDGNSNDWTSSELREYLNSEFYKKITDDAGEIAIVSFERDLTSLDGQTEFGTCEDYVSLLTVDEYRKYRKLLPNTDEWWWLCTPWSTPCNGYEYPVAVVAPSGNFNNYYYYDNCVVRPFCIFSSEIFESEEE